MSLWVLTVIAILILLNALYVAAEFAAVGARVSRVEQVASQGSWLARAVLPIVRDPRRLDNYIAACQIGITASSLVLGAFGQTTVGLDLGVWLHQVAGMDRAAAFGLSALIVLVVLTSVQVVLGELIPKTVALQFPVRTAMFTYLPMKWSLLAFTPFIKFLNGSGNVVLRLLGAGHPGGHHHVHSAEEIDMLVRESAEEGAIHEDDSARLRAGLGLARRTARQLMVPRREIVGLDLLQAPEEQLRFVRNSPFTRLVAYRGDIDEAAGLLHVKDLAAHVARGGSLSDIATLLRPLLRLPEGLSGERVLQQLRSQRARLALVVNEFGDIEGLLTLHDVMSEVLGEAPDEFKAVDDDQPLALEDGTWRLKGDMATDEFLAWAREQGMGEGLDPGDSLTLAGLILTLLGEVPGRGQSVRANGMTLTVERMSGLAIDSVLVSRARLAGGDPHG